MPWFDLELRVAEISATLLSLVAFRLPFQNPDERPHNPRPRPFTPALGRDMAAENP
jgi:hypothetical protein